MGRQQRNLWSLVILAAIIALASTTLSKKSFGRLDSYEANEALAQRYQAQLDIDVQNRWGEMQVAFVENLAQGSVPVSRQIEVLIGLGQEPTTHVEVITPKTVCRIINQGSRIQILRPVQMGVKTNDPVPPMGLEAGHSLEIHPDALFKRYGDVMGIYSDGGAYYMLILVYLPHDYFVLGSESQKMLRFPNQRLRWRWLRIQRRSAGWAGLKVISTEHFILVNEGKPVRLSFETPEPY